MTSTPGRTHYLFRGERFDDIATFLSAVATNARSRRFPADLSGDEFDAQVRELFHGYAGSSARLQAHEFKGLSASLAAALGMEPQAFGDLGVLFHRFDVNGNGCLDEDECVMLAQAMRRRYLDALQPSAPSGPRMLNLEFKCLEDAYTLSEKLGAGGQGAVFLAEDVATGMRRVVKCYDKSNANAPLDEIKEEFTIVRSLDHPTIQRVFDIFEDRSNVYVASEPYLGGHLGELTETAFGFGIFVTPSYLAKVFHQVLQGVVYLHSKYVLHCDLKESNVMIVPGDGGDMREPSAVVIDFGLARNFVVKGHGGGTAGYMPPEVWTRGLWTPKGDVHALGAILFQLFSNGQRCFPGFGDEQIRHSTLNKEPKFEVIDRYWRRCRDLPPLISKMVSKDLHARPTVRQCLEDVFFEKRLRRDDDEDGEDSISVGVVSSLEALSERNKLQKAMLTDIVANLNLAELSSLNAAFTAMDKDGNGLVSEAELREALRTRTEPELLENAVRSLVDPEGNVAYTAFMGQLLASKAADENRLLWAEFLRLDGGAGYLDRERVALLLERPALAKVLAGWSVCELMEVLDFDGDGRISFEEFRQALTGGRHEGRATAAVAMAAVRAAAAASAAHAQPGPY